MFGATAGSVAVPLQAATQKIDDVCDVTLTIFVCSLLIKRIPTMFLHSNSVSAFSLRGAPSIVSRLEPTELVDMTPLIEQHFLRPRLRWMSFLSLAKGDSLAACRHTLGGRRMAPPSRRHCLLEAIIEPTKTSVFVSETAPKVIKGVVARPIGCGRC